MFDNHTDPTDWWNWSVEPEVPPVDVPHRPEPEGDEPVEYPSIAEGALW